MNVTDTLVTPAFGTPPGVVNVKLPATDALLTALVAAPPVRVEALSACPYFSPDAVGAVNVSVALLTLWPPANVFVLLEKPPVAVNSAVIVCGDPGTGMVAVLIAAVPFGLTPGVTVTGAPNAAPSTLNCTVPVGTTIPLAGVTVAVKVTFWP